MKRKALIIGINYIGNTCELSGCINDSVNIMNFIYLLYPSIDLVHLDETNEDINLHPTRQNILKYINWLISDNNQNDSLFFYYSGHGGRLEDYDPANSQHMDETIIPLDVDEVGQITDDELKNNLVVPLQDNVQLVCLFDCCHSGTILDLKYGYKGSKIMDIIQNNENICKNEDKKKVICYSGCRDEEYSWETYVNNSMQGSMTYSFIKVLSEQYKNNTSNYTSNYNSKSVVKYEQEYNHEYNQTYNQEYNHKEFNNILENIIESNNNNNEKQRLSGLVDICNKKLIDYFSNPLITTMLNNTIQKLKTRLLNFDTLNNSHTNQNPKHTTTLIKQYVNQNLNPNINLNTKHNIWNNLTFFDLLNKINQIISKNKNKQTPQISSSFNISTDLPFYI